MKKTSLLLTLTALAFSGLLLSGCGMFRSHKTWDTAQQESPLEIPPQLDRPTTSAALVIPPPGANQPTANGAMAGVGGAPGSQITDGFVVADSVDNAYQRVGKVLAGGSLGQLATHDDAAHSYTLNVSGVVIQQKKKGFFGRIFSHNKQDSVSTVGDNAHPVQISIDTSGTNASEVRAQGDAAAVAKVIDTLKSSLGS